MTLPAGNPMERVLQVFLLLDVIVFGLVIPGMIQVSDRSLGRERGRGRRARSCWRSPRPGPCAGGRSGTPSAGSRRSSGSRSASSRPYQFVTGGVFALLWVVTFVLGKRLAAAAPAP